MRALREFVLTFLVIIGFPCAIAAMVTVTAALLVEGAGLLFVGGNWMGLLAIPIVVGIWYLFGWGLMKCSKHFPIA